MSSDVIVETIEAVEQSEVVSVSIKVALNIVSVSVAGISATHNLTEHQLSEVRAGGSTEMRGEMMLKSGDDLVSNRLEQS